MNQWTGNGQRMIPLEDLPVGSAKEVAEKVRQGKASLRIVGTSWGVEFYICEFGDSADGIRPQVEILLPSTQSFPAPASEEIGIGDALTTPVPAPPVLEESRGKSSLSALTIFCMVSNFIAYMISSGLPQKYVELNPLARPISLLTLARSEGIILAVSIFLLALIRDVDQRTTLHSLVSGIIAADAVNDAALMYTGDWFLAIGLALATAVSIPAVVRLLLPPRGGDDGQKSFGYSPRGTLEPQQH